MAIFNKLFSIFLISLLVIGCSSEPATSTTDVVVASSPKVFKANSTPISTEEVKEEETPTAEEDKSVILAEEVKEEIKSLEKIASVEKEVNSKKTKVIKKATKAKEVVSASEKRRSAKTPRKKGKAKISFEKTTHRYGKISQGEKINHQFKFKNTGTKELVISNVTASCGCTQPSFPFMPILPGEEGYIGVVFDSHGRLGNQKPTITVVTNAKPSTYELHLEGIVDAPESTPSEEKDSIKG